MAVASLIFHRWVFQIQSGKFLPVSSKKISLLQDFVAVAEFDSSLLADRCRAATVG
jgi:hypothetical protein